MSPDELSNAAENLKQVGNMALKAGEMEDAHEYYSQALLYACKVPGNHTQVKFLLSNRALVLHKMGLLAEAEQDAEQCIQIDPGWPKVTNCEDQVLLFTFTYKILLLEFMYRNG